MFQAMRSFDLTALRKSAGENSARPGSLVKAEAKSTESAFNIVCLMDINYSLTCFGSNQGALSLRYELLIPQLQESSPIEPFKDFLFLL